MTKILEQLSTIEIDSGLLEQIDINDIGRNFGKHYSKLDDLKKFRTKYEKQWLLMRWWRNDELADRQLDSAVVQAEFSKAIGQLLMLSILQSKELTTQQVQLNEQQTKLKIQAEGISDQASGLQQQHTELAEQSEKLETLVNDYFELKGLTDDGAQKLIDYYNEIRTTKDRLLEEFSVRTNSLDRRYDAIKGQVEHEVAEVSEQFHQSAQSTALAFSSLEAKMRHALEASSSSLRNEMDTRLTDTVLGLDKKHVATQIRLHEIAGELEAQRAQSTLIVRDLSTLQEQFANHVTQQNDLRDNLSEFRSEVSRGLRRLAGLVVGIAVVVVAIMLGGVAHLFHWI